MYNFMNMNSYDTLHNLRIQIWIHVCEEYSEIVFEFRGYHLPGSRWHCTKWQMYSSTPGTVTKVEQAMQGSRMIFIQYNPFFQVYL